MNTEEKVMTHKKSSSGGKILFCTVTDDNYFPGACVMLYSLRKNFRNFAACDVKVFYHDVISPLSKANRDYLRKIVPNITFDPCTSLSYTDVKTRVEDHKPAFLTLEVFRQYGYDKVVFMDADTYCFRDFSFLVGMDRGFIAAEHFVRMLDNSIGGLDIDVELPRDAERWGTTEVNTGFMIIDKKYICSMVYDKLVGMVPKDSTFLADQPIINRYLGKFLNAFLFKLPPTYNFIFPSDKLFLKYMHTVKIIHYCGQGKDRVMPWYSNASKKSILNKVWQNAKKEMVSSFGSYGTTARSIHEKEDRVLLAGPWVGELGWELFHWQGYLRHLSTKIAKVIVVGREGHQALYEDFCSEYIVHDPKSIDTDCWKCYGGDLGKHYEQTIPHTTYLSGQFNIGFQKKRGTWKPSKKFLEQDFIKYGKFNKALRYDILIHARSTSKHGSAGNNWSIENWNRVVELFPHLSFASVGTTESAHHVEGTIDLRGVSLQQLTNAMASSNFMMGPSSGPIHLATLCGLPQFVWSGDKTTKIRYLKLWNPFHIPVRYLGGGHQPSVEEVCRILRDQIQWLFYK